MATLSLKNINKIYDNNVQAVFDFNLEIKDKEFIVLVGPSGCGKSTTLRMIAGLEDITYGELCIDGQIMNNVAPKDRNIAMVFQNYALYPHMTVYKNMEFALKLRKQNLPIYEENPEIDELSSQLKLIFKEINKMDHKYKKDQNNKDLLDQHIALYKEVFAIDDKINSLRKPIMGTDTLSIKLLNKKIKEFKKEINFINKQITKGKNLSNDQLDVLKGGVKQREYLIEDLNKQVEYYQNNNSEILKSRHLSKQEMNIDINRTAEAIDLTRYLFRKPSALSGGQRQRVALGRAIVRKPKVFLMDEPLSNLDAKLRVQTRSEISKLHKRVGATTIYVTHDQTEAMTMADRIVIMKDGYVQQVGTPNELYNDPTNKFVAGFIGSPSMNFIQGKFEKDNFIFDNGSNYIKVKKGLQNKVGDLFLGIRPEDIYLKGDINNTKPSNPIKVKVTFTELLGAQLVVYGEVDGQSILFEVKASEKIKIDDVLNVCFDLDKMYFFNKDNEERVR